MFMRLRRILLRCLSTFLYLYPSHLNPGRDSECEYFLDRPSLLPSPQASRLPPRAQRPLNLPASPPSSPTRTAFSRAATFCWVFLRGFWILLVRLRTRCRLCARVKGIGGRTRERERQAYVSKVQVNTIRRGREAKADARSSCFSVTFVARCGARKGGGGCWGYFCLSSYLFFSSCKSASTSSAAPGSGFMKSDNDSTTPTTTTPAYAPINVHFTNSMHTPASSSATGDVPFCAFYSTFPRFPSDYPSSTIARAPSNSTPSSSTGSKHAAAAAETEEARHDEGGACAACSASAGGSGSITFAYLESLGAGLGCLWSRWMSM
ncbi:hypothetical protein B0H13DRAFT_132645 [Mycena leptocephala]|nr:hypothetical protein B0H13DRAFT_132645 [Mycena leptocephala]